MQIIKYLIVFLIGMAAIIKSADLFTEGAIGIADIFKISRLVIGLTIVSIATTAPEFTVSTFSSYMGFVGIAVGNAIGSCIANIGLILGIAAILRPIKLKPRFIRQEGTFLIIVSLLVYIFMLNHSLGRIEGLILLIIVCAFFIYIVLRERRTSDNAITFKEDTQPVANLSHCIFKFLIGAVGVVVSARYAIIPSGLYIARYLGVPEIVIGLSMVAIGTSLPELFTAIIATSKKMGELAAGNILGANILNLLWVLGFSSLIKPLSIDSTTIRITMPVMLVITTIMLLFMRKNNSLVRRHGIVLFLVYLSFIFYLLKFGYS